MSRWTVIYYEDETNRCEINDYIEALSENQQTKVLAWIEKLKEEGPLLPRPFADLLEDGIHELRIKVTGDQVRILYFFIFQNFIILTHAFIKTSNRVPVKQIKKAKKIRDDFNKRFKSRKCFEEDLKKV